MTKSRASTNLSPIISSPDQHSGLSNDDAFEGTAASLLAPSPPPPPRKSPTPPPPPRKSPTSSPPLRKCRSPSPSPRRTTPKRSAPQTKPLSYAPTKRIKGAKTHPAIPQKLSYEKSDAELKDVVQKEVHDYFKGVKKARLAREKLEPMYFYLPPDQLRKKVDQRKQDSLKFVMK